MHLSFFFAMIKPSLSGRRCSCTDVLRSTLEDHLADTGCSVWRV
jgi:hypothetical protein